MSKQIPDIIRKALNDTGIDWKVETGSKHYKLRLGNRLVGVLPLGPDSERSRNAARNTVAQIRRAAKELKNDA